MTKANNKKHRLLSRPFEADMLILFFDSIRRSSFEYRRVRVQTPHQKIEHATLEIAWSQNLYIKTPLLSLSNTWRSAFYIEKWRNYFTSDLATQPNWHLLAEENAASSRSNELTRYTLLSLRSIVEPLLLLYKKSWHGILTVLFFIQFPSLRQWPHVVTEPCRG